jgi:hypothetical protein
MFRDSLCPNGCGQPLDESTAKHDVGPDYDVSRTTCRACAARAEARRAEGDSDSGDSSARVWSIRVLKG